MYGVIINRENRMRKSTAVSAILMASILAGFGDSQPNKEIKSPTKCLLPECEKFTYHNGGFCSAEHCREFKRRLKNSNQ